MSPSIDLWSPSRPISVLAAIHKSDVLFRVQLTSVFQYNYEPIRMTTSTREPKERTGKTNFCRFQSDMKNIYHLSTCLHWPVAKSGQLKLPIPQMECSLCLFTTRSPVILMASHLSSLLFTHIWGQGFISILHSQLYRCMPVTETSM